MNIKDLAAIWLDDPEMDIGDELKKDNQIKALKETIISLQTKVNRTARFPGYEMDAPTYILYRKEIDKTDDGSDS